MPRMIRNDNNNGTEEVDANASRDGGEPTQSMKKGPWTAAEDAILIEYVKKYGEGNWNSVTKNSGLARCGKSCRLRWANHLRPNLKKGAFSQEEEQIIIELHAKLGNKWARMASQLPGRTDNEIKNFWNTRMKRRQRAGLPLYPPEIQDETALCHLQQQQQYFAPPHPSSFSLSSLLSSSFYRQNFNELDYSSAANSLPNQPDSIYDTNQYQQFKFSNKNNGNGNLGLPLSAVSPYGSSSSTLFNHSFAAHSAAAADSHDYHSGSYKYGFNPLVPGLNTEISSSQSPPGSATPASSYTSGVDGLMGASSIAIEYYEGNSGLLDALVVEAQALSRSDNKSKSEDSTAAGKLSLKRKSMAVKEHTEDEDNLPVESAMKTAETRRDDFSSSQLSTGKKRNAGGNPLEEMNSMDDDLFSLLNNFPSEMPMPDWYRKGERQPLELENERGASPGAIDQELAWTLGTCWNNMPSIC